MQNALEVRLDKENVPQDAQRVILKQSVRNKDQTIKCLAQSIHRKHDKMKNQLLGWKYRDCNSYIYMGIVHDIQGHVNLQAVKLNLLPF